MSQSPASQVASVPPVRPGLSWRTVAATALVAALFPLAAVAAAAPVASGLFAASVGGLVIASHGFH